MDYRIERKEGQRFIAVVRSFPNEIINDEEHQIADFWTECHDDDMIEAIRNLRPVGKRDLYGLCSPAQKDESTFDYGIGVILDEETDTEKLNEFLEKGYTIWQTDLEMYAVFQCLGNDGECISHVWSQFYKEFLPNTEFYQTEKTDYEIYFENGQTDVFCELWIPIGTEC